MEERKACCRLAEVAALVRTTGSFHIRGGDRGGAVWRASRPPRSSGRPTGLLALQGVRGRGATADAPGAPFPSAACLRSAPRRFARHCSRRSTSSACSPMPSGSSPACRRGCCGGVLQGRLPARLSHRGGFGEPPTEEAHLEIVTPHADFAAALVDFSRGWTSSRLYVRRGSHVVYLKGREEMAELFALAGAQDAALQVEEQAVMKDVRARANRLANWDRPTSRRTSAAALRQTEAITLSGGAGPSRRPPGRPSRGGRSPPNTRISIWPSSRRSRPDAYPVGGSTIACGAWSGRRNR